MRISLASLFLAALGLSAMAATDFTPAPQQFRQEIARAFSQADGLPAGNLQLIECPTGGSVRAFSAGQWFEFTGQQWRALSELGSQKETQFAFPDSAGRRVEVSLPWREIKHLVRFTSTTYLATTGEVSRVSDGKLVPLRWGHGRVNQIAVAADGVLHVAASGGLFKENAGKWERIEIADEGGRLWGAKDVLGVGFDSNGQLWFATRAGVGCRQAEGWKFYEGKDGLPWNDFTGIAAGPGGEVWFGTRLGAIRFDGKNWHYRQGPRWLADDRVELIAVDRQGTAWFGTAGRSGSIERRQMTLAEKAEFYEGELERYVKRTPFGYVAEADLRRPADKTSANPDDSDNDGLWTAMYGAGECFAYGATKDGKAKERAKKAFEALRFLQKVTQGGTPAPPKGYVARTIRSVDLPDPNAGRLEQDRQSQQHHDKLWKVYEPRWPKSADGKWYWKSDTSSDELDGHYFFYPLYYDLCADTESERERVREVVRDLTDHFLNHNYVLLDHDGKPTRWGIFGPQFLNQDPNWWPERGLNSLSILSYLSVASHVTGDAKYAKASRQLIEQHGYAMNLMFPKAQHGPGSGNQSDDEMAFMSYYSLLHCSKDQALDPMVRYSFFAYWANEAPEMNPFFNFAYAAHNLKATGEDSWNRFSLGPWPEWHEDAMETLYGFPMDRLNWSHRNSHRLDLVKLSTVQAQDLDDPGDQRQRGRRVNGKVLPIENRHFNHWNTDPWHLNYGGNGGQLASGAVFLLPYYMGLYHGFIEKPR